MKACLCTLLILGAASLARAAILTQPSNSVASRLLELEDSLKKIIDAKVASLNDPEISIKVSSGCPQGAPSTTEVSICYDVSKDADKTVTVKMNSPGSNFELSFSNIDLDDPASDIKIEPYLDEFIASLKDLLLKPQARTEAVKAALTNAGGKLTEKGLTFKSVGDDQVLFDYNGKELSVKYAIKDKEIQISGDFIDQNLLSDNINRQFVELEVGRLLTSAVIGEIRNRRMALSDTAPGDQAGSQKTLTCDMIMKNADNIASMTSRLNLNGLDLQATDDLITIATRDPAPPKSVKITCETKNENSFELAVVKADFKNVKETIPDHVQAFLGKSLYNLMPMAEGNFEDICTMAIHMLSTNIVEEQLPAGTQPTTAR